MSVKRSVNVINQLRVDTNDLRSIESSVRNDFDELLRAFVTGQGADQAYVLRGFEISMSGAIGNTAASLSLVVADSAIMNGTATVGGTFYLVPSTQAPETLNPVVNSKVSGNFTPNTYNYISLDYTRTPASSTSAPRALWDPVNKTEFSKTLPLAEVLNYKINITTGSFASSSLPVAVVKTDANNKVIEITDKRPLLFRLGQSGLNPNNSSYSYPWDHDTEGRTENPSTSALNTLNPFKGGDKQVQSLKEWMNAIMTEIKLIKGSCFWYTNGSTLVSDINLSNVFTDSLATVMTGRGKFVHDLSLPGVLTWTNDIYLKNTLSNLDITIEAGSVTLSENELAYIQFERNELFQAVNIFTFTNGSTAVNGATSITGISAGDFIKPESESMSKWHKVQSVVGNLITLTSPYSGSNFSGNAVRTKGTFSTVSVADRASVPNSGDIYWLAFRNDNAIPSVALLTSSRTSNIATHTTATNHGLVLGQNIAISGVLDSSFDGTFTVESIPTPDSFTVSNSDLDGASTGGSIASLATIYLRGLGELVQGEEVQVSDETVLNLLEYVGSPSESDVSPVYKYTNYVTNGDNLTLSIATLDKALKDEVTILTDWVTDHQEDRSAFLRSDDTVEFSGGALNLLTDVYLEFFNTSLGVRTSHKIQLANTPIAIANNESIWTYVDRNATTENLVLKRTSVDPIPTVSYADKDVFVLFTRIDALGESYVHIPLHKQLLLPDQPTRLGVSGNGTGTIKVDFIDPVSLSLPTGPTVTIDGVAGVNGDLVLFTNLLTNNNRVYKLGGVGTSITWTMAKVFNYKYPPQDGDAVRIKKGVSHGDQLALYDGTKFTINDVVRYFDFNGTSSNYWEQSSVKTSALLDNSTGTIFSTAVYGSENLIVDYSILRGSTKETGQLFITSDGTNVSVSRHNSYIGDPGITITTQIVTGTLQVLYTSTSTGSNAQIKYSVKRWADGLGGPTGIPSYTGSTVGGGNAAGADKQIQFNASGNLAGDSKFQWDYVNQNLVLGGLVYDVLSAPYTLLDNQPVPVNIISYNATTYRFAVLEYSVIRGTSYRAGRMLIANNGTIATISDDFTETSTSGVAFSVTISGGNVNLNYTTTSTGSSSTFKFSARRWN